MGENKVTFGLKNVYYALYEILDGVVKFKTPIPIPGAVELTLDPRGDLIEFYADDMLYYSASNNQGYDGALNIATIPEKFAVDVLGEELDEVDGVLNELADAKGKQFALLFEFDGDEKATRHVLFNNSASRPTVASKTKTNSAEPNTNELKFVSSPIDINGRRMVKTKTTSKTTQAVYDNWFKEVYTKKSVEINKGA
ncbi:phage tail protein [Bacillus cereus]|uniref:major tail protein n=1 Tax=Bacillus cereus group TaxID=86661 RepID=UPI000A363388|nr:MULTISPECIES: major tail protein [Bacillus cereus group]KAB2396046.1 phage tail protein [Bacillus cereus]MCU4862603.1 phage tail protein [Bacillus cereus]MCU5146795.1 phage tail protein [Bacillus cereus]MCU5491950.1 phage tail protein [Bacillus cereus]OUB74188.1 phage tail protein [Bacillus thuringiensis serovar zhaodongensis]